MDSGLCRGLNRRQATQAKLCQTCNKKGIFTTLFTLPFNTRNKIWDKINWRPNLNNLSRVTNLRRGSNTVGSSWNCNQCFRIWAGALLEPVFGSSGILFKFFFFYNLEDNNMTHPPLHPPHPTVKPSSRHRLYFIWTPETYQNSGPRT